MRRALFSMHAYSTPYTHMTVPAMASTSTPANPRMSTYTAVLVVKAHMNTEPVTVPSG